MTRERHLDVLPHNVAVTKQVLQWTQFTTPELIFALSAAEVNDLRSRKAGLVGPRSQALHLPADYGMNRLARQVHGHFQRVWPIVVFAHRKLSKLIQQNLMSFVEP